MPSLGNSRSVLLVFACVALAYISFWGLEFSADLLGRSPVLDARENLGWVERIRAGQLPQEPLYRALLYPLMLAILPLALDALPSAAILIGLGCHLLSVWLVHRLALWIWKSPAAAWLSALLYAVYPVALYFAVQVLDVTFATTFLLAALVCWFRPSTRVLVWRGLAGFFLGCAVLARPNFLLVALAMPIIGLLFSRRDDVRSWSAALAVSVPLILLLLGQGLINMKLGGEFRMLPWQGGYNLYAANKSGANGKYFVQSLSFEQLPAGVNPTRVESEVLYRQAKGPNADLDIDAMAAYWKQELYADGMGDPLRWVGLMGRKLVYLFNDWEQYNNLSYGYQKQRFDALRFNPLGWGVLLLLASCALMLAWQRADRRGLVVLGLVGLSYALGVLLFFVSARFRLPLAPLLCVLAGGMVYWQQSYRPRRAAIIAGSLLVLAGVVFGNWFGARDQSTFIQDHALLAIAASEQADDLSALEFSGMVLHAQPQRQDMRRIQVTSHFNLWLEALDASTRASHFSQMNDALGGLEQQDAATLFITGVSAWRLDRETDAVDAWRQALAEYPSQAANCAAALLAVGEAAPAQPQALIQQIDGLLNRD